MILGFLNSVNDATEKVGELPINQFFNLWLKMASKPLLKPFTHSQIAFELLRGFLIGWGKYLYFICVDTFFGME